MKLILLYFLFAVLFLVGLVVRILNADPARTQGRGTFVRMRKLKLYGTFLILASLLVLGLALVVQYRHWRMQRYLAELEATPKATFTSNAQPADTRTPEERVLDLQIQKVAQYIKNNPANSDAYGERGNLFAKRQMWAAAENDFQRALQINGNNTKVKFNRAEMNFIQKNYDLARPGFAAIETDRDLGDFASYKVFLCDLFGKHEDNAAKDLDTFNAVGSNPSYYFANATWALYHQNTDEARKWLDSAGRIYPMSKLRLYTASLRTLGYLPLPPLKQNGP